MLYLITDDSTFALSDTLFLAAVWNHEQFIFASIVLGTIAFKWNACKQFLRRIDYSKVDTRPRTISCVVIIISWYILRFYKVFKISTKKIITWVIQLALQSPHWGVLTERWEWPAWHCSINFQYPSMRHYWFTYKVQS